MNHTVPVTVKVKGDVTGKVYEGAFSVATSISLSEILQEDAIRRQLLGFDPNNASDVAARTAEAAAYLQVRLRDTPGWWVAQSLNFKDTNVLTAVYTAVVTAVNAEFAAHKEEGEKARKDLKKDVEKEEE